DHAAGYLMALGVIAGLVRRAETGGSWHARVSLARTGFWLRGLGRIADGFAALDLAFDDISGQIEKTTCGYGELAAVRHAAALSGTGLNTTLNSPDAPRKSRFQIA